MEKPAKGMKSLAEIVPPIEAKQKHSKTKAAKEDASPDAQKADAEPTVMGRPTSFRIEYIAQAEFLCRLGATDVELAEFFDVNQRTINRWKVTHPEFAEAIRHGKDPADDRVEHSLYHKALGTEVEELQAIKLKRTDYDEKGRKTREEEYVEVVPVKRVIPADTTACIFWLKNRRQKQWRDVHKVEHGEPNEFDNVSETELTEFITSEAQKLLGDQSPKPGKSVKH